MSFIVIIAIISFLTYIFIKNFNKKSTNKTNSINKIPNAYNATNQHLLKNSQVQEPQLSKDKFKDKSIIEVTIDYKIDPPQISYSSNENNPNTEAVYSKKIDEDNYNELKLGKRYKQKLGLSNQEVSWLNKFWDPNNVFLSIEGCCIETIKLYLLTIKSLNNKLKRNDSSIQMEVDFFKQELTNYTPTYATYWSDYEYIWAKEKIESDIFLTIFKRAESKLRESYNHKRKISTDFSYYEPKLKDLFESRIGSIVNEIIKESSDSISQPDEATEIELNIQNVNRWKLKLEHLTINFNENSKENFIDKIHELVKLNKKNSSVENIYFEASKFISKYDNTESLKFYIHYLYYDLKSDKFDNKKLTKTIQKTLFKNTEQIHEFEKIVSELIKTKNLDVAINQIQKIYLPKRKKIKLDKAIIDNVKSQHSNTVELLNEFLQDDYEDSNASINIKQINSEEMELDIIIKTENNLQKLFIDEIELNPIQIQLIELFSKNSFNLSVNEIEAFSKNNGVFKNQLIDSINESCYEFLDDILIEDLEVNYSLNQNYYQKIKLNGN